MDEARLLREAKSYDLQALGQIYDQYQQGLYAYSIRLLGDECLAEDCVADTFSRFLQSLSNGHGPSDHLQAYLYRIAHNWITDFYRKKAPPVIELDENIHAETNNQPEAVTDHSLQKARIRSALEWLTAEQRQVILLRFYEGWELAEIAVSVQKPVNAVKSLQHRGLNALKKYLGEERLG